MIEAPHSVHTFAKDRPAQMRGRGALSNASGRFEALTKNPCDDGWDHHPEPPLRTRVTHESPRTIITTNQSPDISFDQSINPYRGCEHGCVYCYARPAHAYMGLSAGLDFESKLFAKPDAAKLLREELSANRYKVKIIAMGTNTDPYQPIEKDYEITRQILEVLNDFNHPVMIVTKSHRILRDQDILAEMAKRNLVKVALSITTLDRQLAREMEPRASTPNRRLAALTHLSAAGIPTAVMVAPVIPALNEAEIERILEKAAKASVEQAGYIMLRLPLEIEHLFQEWIEGIVPNRAKHIMTLVREMRGGKAYDSQWFTRHSGKGPYATLIRDRFKAACKRLGLNQDLPPLDTSQFAIPRERIGDHFLETNGQISLF